MENIVELKGVTKTYKIGEEEFKALDSVDLSIGKGEFVVVLGPSRSRKINIIKLTSEEWIKLQLEKLW